MQRQMRRLSWWWDTHVLMPSHRPWPLQPLCELELIDVMGPTPEALDDAIRALPNLHRLHVRKRARPASSRFALHCALGCSTLGV